jgi:integrase
MIKRLPDGRWLVDVEPIKNQRIRKRFDTKGEALRFERHTRTSAQSGQLTTVDRRRLSDLVNDWHRLHGHALKDGSKRLRTCLAISIALGDPVASALTGHQVSAYRAKRSQEGISPKTLNNHLGYLNAVYNELKALGHIVYDNPLTGVRPLKVPERELSWLTVEEISTLLETVQAGSDNPHVAIITRTCLATGCRWSEAEGLSLRDLQNGAVVFSGVRTKSGRTRTVPLEPGLFSDLLAHLRHHKVMTSSLGAFRRALVRSGIELPQGQASHALRHTFASHFVMGGGNILVLQKILGHSTINMTMRYSHLAPGHLQEAVRLSPLSKLDTFSTPVGKEKRH